ncbi:hypothetical protein [Nocardia bhagyanarayanae]|uniref:Uncharacterized protein n=1 Tax=Nocardia bhagyanarayanae TaxID=1215925 RepID=A0A543FHL3_9NOCA|nr:hypothetical protein [Nocardia bhagyanarayanae]TQM33204.1 hypothetical protein FB390_4923 [Nocardia bhagyanarayanae]
MPEATNANATPSRAVTAWTQGLLCVAIVASGVIVGGLLHDPDPDLTTTPLTTTSTTAEAEPPQAVVTPPVTYPTHIPGCAAVEPPDEGGSVGFMVSGEFGYDNPAYPWFSGPKAVAMSTALHEALPDGVVIGFEPVGESLLFQPIPVTLDDSAEFAKLGGFTDARATLRRGDLTGSLWVSVRHSAAPIPPCVAGHLDERRLLADGTTVDTHDTWSQVDGVRTLSRTAHAYAPDGSVVVAAATDAPYGLGPTGTVPLSVDELVGLVSAPGIRVAAPVPPGTPEPPDDCRLTTEDSAPIDEDRARGLDAVLARIPLDGLTLDRPLGALRPGADDSGGVCQAVRVTAAGHRSRLSIAIGAGRTAPTQSAAPPSGERLGTRQLPDGTVVENHEARTTLAETSELTRTVVVTRPSGATVQVVSVAESPAEPLSVAQLEAIALTPGLEVS